MPEMLSLAAKLVLATGEQNLKHIGAT